MEMVLNLANHNQQTNQKHFNGPDHSWSWKSIRNVQYWTFFEFRHIESPNKSEGLRWNKNQWDWEISKYCYSTEMSFKKYSELQNKSKAKSNRTLKWENNILFWKYLKDVIQNHKTNQKQWNEMKKQQYLKMLK
jgi:hypothetical protein